MKSQLQAIEMCWCSLDSDVTCDCTVKFYDSAIRDNNTLYRLAIFVLLRYLQFVSWYYVLVLYNNTCYHNVRRADLRLYVTCNYLTYLCCIL